jgi:capsid protein
MWIGPTLVYIDKENEVKGDILSVNANMDTLERIAASRGMHWKEMIDQRATEIAYCKKKGVEPNVVIPGDPTRRTVPGVDPSDPNAADNATTEDATA